MKIKKISETFAVCGQIAPEDLSFIKDQSYAAIVCARPDHEQANQPSLETLRQAARAFEIEVFYVPVSPSGATQSDHASFKEVMHNLAVPVLGYCRSGMRAQALWSGYQSGQ